MHVSGRFCTLTSPFSGPRAPFFHLPLAGQAVSAAQTASKLPAVLPSFNGGLHCGQLKMAQYADLTLVLPSFNGGLHCGNECRADNWPDVVCSRRSTAGSIAAP